MKTLCKLMILVTTVLLLCACAPKAGSEAANSSAL